MLQQTRVATAIPYFRRFVRTFPTVRSLSRAPLERVLKLWSGLGYYRRARHLHAAARTIVRDFAGHFPRSLDHACKRGSSERQTSFLRRDPDARRNHITWPRHSSFVRLARRSNRRKRPAIVRGQPSGRPKLKRSPCHSLDPSSHETLAPRRETGTPQPVC